MLGKSIEVSILINRIQQSEDINVVAQSIEDICKLANKSGVGVAEYIKENA